MLAQLQMIVAAFRLAILAILRSKTRAALTVLGILIGVAAVVTVTALGEGARSSIAKKIEGLGSNVLYVFPRSTQTSGARSTGSGRLTEMDGLAIAREAASAGQVAPFTSTIGTLVYGEENTSTTIAGVNRDYFFVRKFPIARGRRWTEEEARSKAKVVVVAPTVVKDLYGDKDPLGTVLRVGMHPYRVIGVTKPKGASAFGNDEDDRILMPSSSFRARVRPMGRGRVGMLIVSATSANTVDRAKRQIEDILRQRHHIGELDEPDFVVRTQKEFRKRQEAVYNILSVLLISVAGVSLFVGGIGVMNIMLVSVTERTREIGIRMAIGASSSDILIQFLVEAVVLAIIGGLCGTVLGIAAIYGFSRALEWPMRLPIKALTLAITCSAGIGVVFGYLPARRAARLDPIDALRQE